MKYKWINRFHNTDAISTLSREDADDVDAELSLGYITSKDNNARKLKRLEKALCPHNNNQCACWAMSEQV